MCISLSLCLTHSLTLSLSLSLVRARSARQRTTQALPSGAARQRHDTTPATRGRHLRAMLVRTLGVPIQHRLQAYTKWVPLHLRHPSQDTQCERHRMVPMARDRTDTKRSICTGQPSARKASETAHNVPQVYFSAQGPQKHRLDPSNARRAAHAKIGCLCHKGKSNGSSWGNDRARAASVPHPAPCQKP